MINQYLPYPTYESYSYAVQLQESLDSSLVEFDKEFEIKEGVALTTASFAIALPGLLKAVGWIYKKLNNLVSTKQITKTTFEKQGDILDKWIHEAAKRLAKIILKLFGIDNSKLATNIGMGLLYGIILALMGMGISSALTGFSGYNTLEATAKGISTLIKQGEFLIAIIAVLGYLKYTGQFDNIEAAIHSAESCVDKMGPKNPKKILLCMQK